MVKNSEIAEQSTENEISWEGRWKTEPSALRVGSLKTIWSHFNPLYLSFTVNQGRDFFPIVSACVCVWTYGCMCMCANRVVIARRGMFFLLCMLRAVTYLSKCVSGSRQRSCPSRRPLESSACEGQVWFRERQGRLAWKWNLLSLCQTSRLTDCPQPLITSKSLLSSHRPLLLLLQPPLHTNMRLMHRRKTAEMGLFNNHNVKQCLHERETWIQLLVAVRNHLLRAELSLLIAFSFLHKADFALSHF